MEFKVDSPVNSKHYQPKDFLLIRDDNLKSGALPLVEQNDLESYYLFTQCNIQICRICFATHCKLYSMKTIRALNRAYDNLTELSAADEDHLPSYLCTACVDQVFNCAHFRIKSLRAHKMLLDIIKSHGEITLELVESLIRSHDSHSPNVTQDRNIDNSNYNIDIGDPDETEDEGEHVDGIDGFKTEIDYAVGHDIVNNYEINADSANLQDALIEEIEAEKDDFAKEDNFNGYLPVLNEDVNVDDVIRHDNDDIVNDNGSSSEEDIVVDEIVNVNNHVMNNYNRSVSSPNLDEDVIVDDVISDNNDVRMVYSAKLLEDFIENSLKAKLGKVLRRSRRNVEESFVCDAEHAFIFVGEDVLEKLPTQKTGQTVNLTRSIVNKIRRLRRLNKLKVATHQAQGDNDKIKVATHRAQRGYKIKIATHQAQANDKTKVATHQAQDDDGLSTDRLSCELCPYQTPNDLHLLEHLKAHAAPKSYTCNVCSYKCIHKKAFKFHSQTHSGKKIYSCNFCEKSYRGNHCFQRHLKTHSGAEQYSSGVAEGNLEINSDEPYSYSVCDKVIYEKTYFTKHLRMHYYKDMRFSCGVCSKQFNTEGYLKIHLRTHNTEKFT